jgi:alpha-1,2-mannosyltransferase
LTRSAPALGRFVHFLREGTWLTGERVVAYATMAVVLYALGAVLVILTAQGVLDAAGRPVGTDFTGVWTAGALALKGEAAAAYDWVRHAAEQVALAGRADVPFYGWHYPPIFLLAAAPLALLPYGWALLGWMGLTLLGYVACLRRILPHPRTWLVALAFPAVFVNLGHGQNGFFSAALLGSALLLLERRPIGAGVLLGILCYKPQIAFLVPFALLAGQQWRALLAMAATVFALSGAALAAFGVEAWVAFGASLGLTQGQVLEAGAAGFFKMVSVFAAARLLGADPALSWMLQGLASITAIGMVSWAWSRPGPVPAKWALLVAAVPLATPYAFDYDLMVLAVPAAVLVRLGSSSGFLPWEKAALLGVCLLPAVARPLAFLTGLPAAPLLELGLLAALVRRVRGGQGEGTPG